MTPAAKAGAITGLVTIMKSEVEGDLDGAIMLAPGAYTSTHGPLLALKEMSPSLPAHYQHCHVLLFSVYSSRSLFTDCSFSRRTVRTHLMAV